MVQQLLNIWVGPIKQLVPLLTLPGYSAVALFSFLPKKIPPPCDWGENFQPHIRSSCPYIFQNKAEGLSCHSDPGLLTDFLILLHAGGLFAYVSGANFLGEIIEWIGFALASWSLPALAFAFFSFCFLGLRAFHHHR